MLKNVGLRVYEKFNSQYYLYERMHKYQTLEYVKFKRDQYSNLNNKKMNMKEALNILDSFVDASDPDVDVPNSIHAYQTSERIRSKYPKNIELQLTGLIHDIGKVLILFGEPQWAIVGDTYVVGCKFPESIVYYDTMKSNSDYNKYDELGIYKEKCGLDNLYLSYGHDEYLYQVLLQNKDKHKLSKKYLDIIRYHSFYPWHTSGDYKQFMDDSDEIKLKDVNNFNEFDLYSKEDDINISEGIKQYYNYYLDEYFPEELQW